MLMIYNIFSNLKRSTNYVRTKKEVWMGEDNDAVTSGSSTCQSVVQFAP